MARVQMYLTGTCGYCRAALRLLERKGITDIDQVRVDLDAERRAQMRARSGRTSVPQIWIGGHYVGGFEELYELERAGGLDELLALERT